jgi:hypothetical protein
VTTQTKIAEAYHVRLTPRLATSADPLRRREHGMWNKCISLH